MTTSKKVGLGKGFDALIPQNFDKSFLLEDREKIEKIPVAHLVPNPDQPRQHFDQSSMDELAASIKQHGIVQPLVVMPYKGGYAIVAGERRWRAAQLAGLDKVPAIVRTLQDLERIEIAIVENVQRVDLSALEQARSIERLRHQFSMSYADVARRLGKAESTVSNIARLLQLPEAAQQALNERRITEGHARAILAVRDTEKQMELLELIQSRGWSVRQAEQFATSLKEGYKDAQARQARMNAETPETKRLSSYLGGAPVTVRRLAKGGKLEIGFKDDEEFAAIMAKLKQ